MRLHKKIAMVSLVIVSLRIDSAAQEKHVASELGAATQCALRILRDEWPSLQDNDDLTNGKAPASEKHGHGANNSFAGTITFDRSGWYYSDGPRIWVMINKARSCTHIEAGWERLNDQEAINSDGYTQCRRTRYIETLACGYKRLEDREEIECTMFIPLSLFRAKMGSKQK